MIASLVVAILYYPLFDPLPKFKRYLSFDFLMSSWTQMQYFLRSYDLSHLSISHWNQFAAAGSPTIVSVGTYYLPNYLLKFFFNQGGGYLSTTAFQIFLLAHLVIAAIGMYLLLYKKVTGKWLAIFGSGLFLVASYMMESNWVEYIIAIALLPWMVLLIEKFLAEKKFAWCFLASFLAFQQFVINPQLFFYSMIFIILYALNGGVDRGRIKQLLLFIILTLLYSAIYLLPVQEFSQYSVRNNILRPDYINSYTTKASSIFQFIVNFGENHVYLGAISVIMLVTFIATLTKKRDYRLVSIGLLLLIFSTNTSVIGMITRLLPGLNMLRWQSRMLELVIFTLILVLVRAIDRYVFNYKRDLKIALWVGLMVILTYSMVLRSDSVNAASNIEQVSYSLLFIGLFCFALFGRHKGFITDRQLVACIAVLIVTDVSRAFVLRRDAQLDKYQLTATGELARTEWFWKENRHLYAIDNQYRLGIAGSQNIETNEYLLNGNYAAKVYSASGGRDSAAVLKSFDDYLTAATRNPHLFDLANVNQAGHYLPRAFIVNCYALADNDAAILENMADPHFTGETFVYLNRDAAAELSEVKGDCNPYRPITVDQKTDLIDFGTVVTDRPAILFISDNWYPGWNAYVNGNATEILKADYTFKAVVLPAGSNEVIMKYEPQSIPKGALVTWVSLLGSVLYIVFKRNPVKVSHA